VTERVVENDGLARALNRAEARLKISEQRLLLAVDTAQIATWELDPSDRSLIADRRCRLLHGLPSDGPMDLGSILQKIDPSHRAQVAESIETLLAARGPAGFELEYPVTDDGSTRWVFTRGQLIRTESGPR
jgi:PAS domain-containing protein